jgi:hypothetical protein
MIRGDGDPLRRELLELRRTIAKAAGLEPVDAWESEPAESYYGRCTALQPEGAGAGSVSKEKDPSVPPRVKAGRETEPFWVEDAGSVQHGVPVSVPRTRHQGPASDPPRLRGRMKSPRVWVLLVVGAIAVSAAVGGSTFWMMQVRESPQDEGNTRQLLEAEQRTQQALEVVDTAE